MATAKKSSTTAKKENVANVEEKKIVKSTKKSKPELNQFLNEIEKRAYEIYLERMSSNKPGDDISDWLQAEAEIKAKYNL